MSGDLLSLDSDQREGKPLIEAFMKEGTRTTASEPLDRLRERALEQISQLPQSLRTVERGPEYSVAVSNAIRDLAREVDKAQSRAGLQSSGTTHLPVN
jgi:hypothetical protein